MSEASGQEAIAFLVLDSDLKIKSFNMDRCRALASDPNPHLSGTAKAMLQLIEACITVVKNSDDKQDAILSMENLSIVDGRVQS